MSKKYYRPSDRMNRFYDRLIITAIVVFFVLVATCTRSESEELSFEHQVTRQERQAISIAVLANLIRRQNIQLGIATPRTRKYEEYVPEKEYPSSLGEDSKPLPSPSQRSWHVEVSDETVASSDKWGFWATSTRTVYRLKNTNGDEARLTLEWRE